MSELIGGEAFETRQVSAAFFRQAPRLCSACGELLAVQPSQAGAALPRCPTCGVEADPAPAEDADDPLLESFLEELLASVEERRRRALASTAGAQAEPSAESRGELSDLRPRWVSWRGSPARPPTRARSSPSLSSSWPLCSSWPREARGCSA